MQKLFQSNNIIKGLWGTFHKCLLRLHSLGCPFPGPPNSTPTPSPTPPSPVCIFPILRLSTEWRKQNNDVHLAETRLKGETMKCYRKWSRVDTFIYLRIRLCATGRLAKSSFRRNCLIPRTNRTKYVFQSIFSTSKLKVWKRKHQIFVNNYVSSDSNNVEKSSRWRPCCCCVTI